MSPPVRQRSPGAGETLAQARERILLGWQERLALAKPLAPRDVETLFAALALGLEGDASAEGALRDVGTRLGQTHPLCDALIAVDQLQASLLDVLGAEDTPGPVGQRRVLECFHTTRLALVEAAQLRQQHLERALVRSEERYLIAARAAGLAIWDCELADERIHWSHSAESVLGRPVEALSTLERWLEHVHPSDRERVSESLWRATEEGQRRWSESFQFLRADGAWADVLGRGWILHDGAGAPLRMAGGFIDVSEQRRLERELLEAVRVRDEFLSLASHELRTPLTALQLQIQSLTRGPGFQGLEERLQQRLERADRSVERLVALVNDLLDVSRISAGHLKLDLEEVNFTEVVRDVSARLEPEVRRSGSPLSLVLPEAVRGVWDRLRLEQIVTNLLSNAVKYGEGRQVTITLEAHDGAAVLKVVDLGIGIPPEEQTRIFQRFRRAVSERNFGGFGLGLWVVERIVHQLGGTIGVKSAVGAGSTFEVTLPPQGARE